MYTHASHLCLILSELCHLRRRQTTLLPPLCDHFQRLPLGAHVSPHIDLPRTLPPR